MNPAELFFRLSAVLLGIFWLAAGGAGFAARETWSRHMEVFFAPAAKPVRLAVLTIVLFVWFLGAGFLIPRHPGPLALAVALFLMLGAVKTAVYYRHYAFIREKIILPLLRGGNSAALGVMLGSAVAAGCVLLLLALAG